MSDDQLDLAAFHLYEALRDTNPTLPSWDSEDVGSMRVDARYRAQGAHKRGNALARKAVIERLAIVLATANGDIWPACDNQIHRGLSEDRRQVIAAMRRQRYRHQAILMAAEVARFYEIDLDTDASLALTVENATRQREADAKIVSAYRATIGKGEVVAVNGVRA